MKEKGKRYASLWFPYLTTDRHAIRQPGLRRVPFVLAAPVHGRMVITEANAVAKAAGIYPGMVVADAKACLSELEVADAREGLAERLLKVLGLWCIRFRSEEHTSELQSRENLVCRLLLEKKK